MRLSELIAALEEAAGELEARATNWEGEHEVDPDPEIKVAIGAQWPTSHLVDAVVDLTWECRECGYDMSDEGHAEDCTLDGKIEPRGLWIKTQDDYDERYAPRQVWA